MATSHLGKRDFLTLWSITQNVGGGGREFRRVIPIYFTWPFPLVLTVSAIGSKSSNIGQTAVVYCNRALVQMRLKNYGKAMEVCCYPRIHVNLVYMMLPTL